MALQTPKLNPHHLTGSSPCPQPVAPGILPLKMETPICPSLPYKASPHQLSCLQVLSPSKSSSTMPPECLTKHKSTRVPSMLTLFTGPWTPKGESPQLPMGCEEVCSSSACPALHAPATPSFTPPSHLLLRNYAPLFMLPLSKQTLSLSV